MTANGQLQHPCLTCGAKPGEPCRPTGTATSRDEWWKEYRRLTPHPSRGVSLATAQMWTTFVDLGAYREDPSELGAEADDMNRVGAVCLYMIADRLVRALAEAHEEDEEEDEDES